MRGVLAVIVVALAAACTSTASKSATGPTSTTAVASPPAASGSASALQNDYVSVVRRVRASVVEISTDAGLGSGIVYDDKGDVVTNAHVVGNASRFRVTLVDGRSLDATLVGTYPPDDLAVIKTSGDDKLAPATFADSSKVEVGQITLAIGNPLGLASSVTDGIVSSTGRTVSEGGGIVLPSTIQTSAPINPGNSGGALVNLDGQVIGIPTLAATDPQLGGGAAAGIGFAIPANTVKRIADQLVNSDGKVSQSGRAALGIEAATVSSFTGGPEGVLVRSVIPNGPAAGAGIKVGDVITAVNAKSVPTLDDLGTVLAGLSPGDVATVDVIRDDGSKQSLKVTLGNL
ncbi:MAG: S1C family serine protease [Acidimicrobiales bacterium]